MTPRRTAALCLVLVGWMNLPGCNPLVSTRDEYLGGEWFIRWEKSQLAESGGLHPFLHRRTRFSSRRVEENTWNYRYLGDDCVLYEPGNSNRHELMAACGEHTPIVISDVAPDPITGPPRERLWVDNPMLIDGTLYTIQEIEEIALREP